MSTTAVPKLIQRFRARELQRFINRGGLRSPNRTNEGRTPLYMQDLKNIDVKKDIRMGVPLHNPFLPRALFKREVESEVDVSGFPFGLSSLGDVGKAGKGGNGKEGTGKKKERKMWAPRQYSLRRQKELVKAARASGTLHLLPPGPKLSLEELQEAKREARRRARAAKETSMKVQQSIAHAKAAKAQASTTSESTFISAPQETASQETSTRRTSSTRSQQKRRQPRWLLRTPNNLSNRRTSPTQGYPGITFNWTGKSNLPPNPHSSPLTIYATRRRMFKGHKWERHLTKRRAQIAVRMRDMDKRVERFKNVYMRRRAKPLKPAVPRKKESLPF